MISDEALVLVKEINKKHGPDTVVLGSDMAIPGRFTSGSLSLDVALGGGWPANQWVEVMGHESAGKTMVAFKTIAANQRINPDYTTFWLASEHYDEQQATALGIDNSRVIVAPTQDMEKALQMVVDATASKACHCIVLDSYPALLPSEEREKSMDGFTVGVHAKLMNQFIRKLGAASKRDVRGADPEFHGIVINQYRDKITTFGDPRTTPGGQGKNYFFYARLEVKRLEYKTEKRPGVDDPVKVGQTVRFTTIKNKSAAPGQRATVDYYFRGAPFAGFRRGDYDLGKEYVQMGRLFHVINGTARWPMYRGVKYNGEKELTACLREDVDLKNTLRDDVMDVAKNPLMVDQITTQEYEEAVGDE
jgi:recombination protein RecA